jgi:hypothetical protein
MKDYKLKQRNLRASHTLGWHLKDFFFEFCFSLAVKFRKKLPGHRRCTVRDARSSQKKEKEKKRPWRSHPGKRV